MPSIARIAELDAGSRSPVSSSITRSARARDGVILAKLKEVGAIAVRSASRAPATDPHGHLDYMPPM